MDLGWSLCCCVAKLRLPRTQVAGHRVTVTTLSLPQAVILPSCSLSDFYREYEYPNQTDLRDVCWAMVIFTDGPPEVRRGEDPPKLSESQALALAPCAELSHSALCCQTPNLAGCSLETMQGGPTGLRLPFSWEPVKPETRDYQCLGPGCCH